MLRRLYIGLLLIALVLVVGTVGYMLIEQLPIFDAFYMTVITVATVGFREIPDKPTMMGRLYTVVLIFAGIGSMGFALGTFIDFLVEGHLRGLLEERSMTRRIDAMSGHHIICGLGRVGTEVAHTLERDGADFVVVERDEYAVEAARQAGWVFMQSDAAEEETLVEAGIERAASLVAALDTDADNVFVTLTARQLNPKLLIVARSSTENSEAKLRRAGADKVTTPSVIGGRRMASMLTQPLVSDYLDLVTKGDDFEFRLEQFAVSEASAMVGSTIADCRLHDRYGVFVLAVHSVSGQVNLKPQATTVISAGDTLVLLGTVGGLTDLAQRS